MDKDLATVQEISSFVGKLVHERGINPLHGLTLMAMALRESTVTVCNALDIPPATGLAFVGNSVIAGGSVVNTMRPSDGRGDMKGC